MRVGPSGNRPLHRACVVIATMLLCAGFAAPAGAQSTREVHPRNLVVLGDSFASGVGNLPYLADSGLCKRSDDAYGPLLARTRLVKLQAFVACSGATTEQVWGTGPNGTEPPQIDSITSDTDVVTVQALGNDFYVGAIEALCFVPGSADCTLETPFPSTSPLAGMTVGGIVASIPGSAPDKLTVLYDKIDQKLLEVHSHARVVVTDYPNIVGNGGPFCPGVTTEETRIAATMVAALDSAIKDVATQRRGYRYAPVASLFRGHDACQGLIAVYPPLPPSFGFPASQDPSGQGALHPNRLGQAIYAGAVGKRLFF